MSKYNAQKTVYNNITYDSKLEAQVAERLDRLKSDLQGRHVIHWVRQVPYELIPGIKGKRRASIYQADFLVAVADGETPEPLILVEVKGYNTAVWKLKYKLFLSLYPEADLRIVRSVADVNRVILENWHGR